MYGLNRDRLDRKYITKVTEKSILTVSLHCWNLHYKLTRCKLFNNFGADLKTCISIKSGNCTKHCLVSPCFLHIKGNKGKVPSIAENKPFFLLKLMEDHLPWGWTEFKTIKTMENQRICLLRSATESLSIFPHIFNELRSESKIK